MPSLCCLLRQDPKQLADPELVPGISNAFLWAPLLKLLDDLLGRREVEHMLVDHTPSQFFSGSLAARKTGGFGGRMVLLAQRPAEVVAWFARGSACRTHAIDLALFLDGHHIPMDAVDKRDLHSDADACASWP